MQPARTPGAVSFPHGVMFHQFHGEDHAPQQGSIDAEALERIISRFGSRLISADQWLDRLEQGRLGPTDVCLTFDDNLRCQFDVAAPVLEQAGIRAFWFIATCGLEGPPPRFEIYRAFREQYFDTIEDFYDAFLWAIRRSVHAKAVAESLTGFNAKTFLAAFSFYSDSDRRFRYIRDEVLTPAQYDELMLALMASLQADPERIGREVYMGRDELLRLHRRGHILGLHSHTHPMRLAKLAPDEQRREYQANAATLQRLTGDSPVAMAHPCNSYSLVTLGILRELGIRAGFCSNMEYANPSELEFARVDHAVLLRELGGAGVSAQCTVDSAQ